MPCRRLLAQLPTPTMPIAIFPIRLTRVRGRHQPVHGRAPYTQQGEGCKSPERRARAISCGSGTGRRAGSRGRDAPVPLECGVAVITVDVTVIRGVGRADYSGLPDGETMGAGPVRPGAATASATRAARAANSR